MSNIIAPARNYSLNVKTQMKANLAWRIRRPASRKLLRPLLQVILAPGNWMWTPSAFLLVLCTCTPKNIPTTERKWKLVPANSSYGIGYLSTAISKMVTRLVRHHDQEERQSEAAVRWDTIRPKVLKAFAKQGARDFSEEDWLRLIHEGSSKTRFEHCEDSKNSLAYFRASQGHSGGITIAPVLMQHILIPYNWKQFVFHRSCSFSIQSILEIGLIA